MPKPEKEQQAPDIVEIDQPAEPERVPIDNLGEGYNTPTPTRIKTRQDGSGHFITEYVTAHKGAEGWYEIVNSGPADAFLRHGREEARNARLKDPVENGLYRTNSAGTPIRPMASSGKFVDSVNEADAASREIGSEGISDKPGNYDIGNPRAHISRGRGSNGSDEKKDIDVRSPSIVLSYEARDKALSEGKSIEEAQRIGAEVYRKIERIRVKNDPNNPSNSREARSVTFKPSSTTETEEEASPTLSESQELHDDSETKRSIKELIRRTGRIVLVGAKIAREAGWRDLVRFSGYKIEDAFDSAVDVVKDKFADVSVKNKSAYVYRNAKEFFDKTAGVIQYLKDRREQARRIETIRSQAAARRDAKETIKSVQRLRDYIAASRHQIKV
jgi:hypothetical protein